ncbi:MAG: L-histidine N(alpha)-methyltransferase [Rhodospirillales bacterium]|nr:L-histidine N(alpha)-methyltransferase [Rhodospirillales bacterium]
MKPDTISLLDEFVDLEPEIESFQDALLRGLSAKQKYLPCKFFYDETGSELFNQICELDEYYVTRTENRILEENAIEISRIIGRGCNLFELGSGSSRKVKILLDVLESPAGYTALDISKEHLIKSCAELSSIYPGIPIGAICTDYSKSLVFPFKSSEANNTVVFFPGSSLGNFDTENAIKFLGRVANLLKGSEGGFLIGIDLKKDREVLEAAYDDSDGVTAKFNLNLLIRANKELNANFDVSKFFHRALYNHKKGRIEMHLVSRISQIVSIGSNSFEFFENEYIHTENSYKYSLSQFEKMWREAGFNSSRHWCDLKEYFSVHYLKL